ncbi:MAG TPA: sigma 54-interacting transcriptional regulator, partial [Candidatus Eisenbacteria bacterium]|nr:sigma 54-interacting transcriptional regulator [Candidatus Eisenbacteria bacterium]
LSEIAEIASETLELREVFDRVGTSVQRVIPFYKMGVVRIIDGSHVVLHAITFTPDKLDPKCSDAKSSDPMPVTMWSPRMRPHAGPTPRINDAKKELDPSFPLDAMALEGGMGSGMWEPFRAGNTFVGGVWLSSQGTYAFTDEHQEVLKPIAALLGSAVEHWKLWDIEQRRRDRLDRIEALLGTLAQTLDVREVFEPLSEGMRAILPHDMMCLTELDMGAKTIRISAIAGKTDSPAPTEPVALTDAELERRNTFEIMNDIVAEIPPDTERHRLIISSGMRSWLRVPVFLSGQVQGGLSFFHREPARYTWEDTEVAIRLADRVALMLSHQRLSDEARVAAEARERAERLEATVQTLARELESRGRGRVIGVSPSWKETLTTAQRVMASETTVLITGESGTGKEVISSIIHQGSPRSSKPFVAINCAALPETLLESELFGHEKGAFTGAIATKIGRVEQAAGGTLFLDEIAEMSPTVQAKFLRVLEQREFQRVGGSRTLKAEVRVIAATNRDLGAAIAKQTFREDLFYRLNVFQIHIAPLRERPDDILPLAEAFLDDLGRTMGRPAAGISKDARGWLLSYAWPGNVRELRNAIERAILMSDGGLITRDHLPAAVSRPTYGAMRVLTSAPPDGRNSVEVRSIADGMNLGDVERGLVEKALEQAKGNKSRAARLLGLTRAQLYSRIEKYGVQ